MDHSSSATASSLKTGEQSDNNNKKKSKSKKSTRKSHASNNKSNIWLLRITEACMKHKLTHDRDAQKSLSGGGSGSCSSVIPPKCQKDLRSLRHIFPRVEQSYMAALTSSFSTVDYDGEDDNHDGDTTHTNSSEAKIKKIEKDRHLELGKDALHLASFYESVLHQSFCPHSLLILDSDSANNEGQQKQQIDEEKKILLRLKEGIFPRVYYLLQFINAISFVFESSLLSPSEKNDNHQNDISTLIRLSQTISDFLCILTTESNEHGENYNEKDQKKIIQQITINLIHDFILLLKDLQYSLDNGLVLNSTDTNDILQVQLFSSTLSSGEEAKDEKNKNETKMEEKEEGYYLDLHSEASIHSVQSCCFYVLLNLYTYLLNNHEEDDITLSSSAMECLMEHIQISSLTCTNNSEEELKPISSIEIILLWKKLNAAKLLYKILSHYTSSPSQNALGLYSMTMVRNMICKMMLIHFQSIHHRHTLIERYGHNHDISSQITKINEEHANILWTLLRDFILVPSSSKQLSNNGPRSSTSHSSLILPLIDIIPLFENTLLSSPSPPTNNNMKNTASRTTLPDKKLAKGILQTILYLYPSSHNSNDYYEKEKIKSYCITPSFTETNSTVVDDYDGTNPKVHVIWTLFQLLMKDTRFVGVVSAVLKSILFHSSPLHHNQIEDNGLNIMEQDSTDRDESLRSLFNKNDSKMINTFEYVASVIYEQKKKSAVEQHKQQTEASTFSSTDKDEYNFSYTTSLERADTNKKKRRLNNNNMSSSSSQPSSLSSFLLKQEQYPESSDNNNNKFHHSESLYSILSYVMNYALDLSQNVIGLTSTISSILSNKNIQSSLDNNSVQFYPSAMLISFVTELCGIFRFLLSCYSCGKNCHNDTNNQWILRYPNFHRVILDVSKAIKAFVSSKDDLTRILMFELESNYVQHKDSSSSSSTTKKAESKVKAKMKKIVTLLSNLGLYLHFYSSLHFPIALSFCCEDGKMKPGETHNKKSNSREIRPQPQDKEDTNKSKKRKHKKSDDNDHVSRDKTDDNVSGESSLALKIVIDEIMTNISSMCSSLIVSYETKLPNYMESFEKADESHNKLINALFDTPTTGSTSANTGFLFDTQLDNAISLQEETFPCFIPITTQSNQESSGNADNLQQKPKEQQQQQSDDSKSTDTSSHNHPTEGSNSNRKSLNCRGTCKRFSSVFGLRKNLPDTYCLCGLLRRGKGATDESSFLSSLRSSKDNICQLKSTSESIDNNNNKIKPWKTQDTKSQRFSHFDYEISFTLLETCLPLKERCILFPCLHPVKTPSSNRGTSTLDSLTRLIQSPTTSPSTTVSILTGFPLLLMSLTTVTGDQQSNVKDTYSFFQTIFEDWKPYLIARTDHSLAVCRRSAFFTLSILIDLIAELNLHVHIDKKNTQKLRHQANEVITTRTWNTITNLPLMIRYLSFISETSDEMLPLFQQEHHGFKSLTYLCKLVDDHFFDADEDKNTALSSFDQILSAFLTSVKSNGQSPSSTFSSFSKESSSYVRLAAWKFISRASLFCSTNELRKHKVPKEKKGASTIDVDNDQMDVEQKDKRFCTLEWLWKAPFTDNDFVIRQYAARNLGRILLENECCLFYSLFLSKDEWLLLEKELHLRQDQKKQDKRCLSVNSQINSILSQKKNGIVNLNSILTRFLKELEENLHKFCSVQQSQLSFTIRNSTSTSSLSSYSRSFLRGSQTMETSAIVSRQHSAICALSSICEYANLTTTLGSTIFEGCFMHLVRFWVNTTSLSGYNQTSTYNTPSTSCYNENVRNHKISSLAFSELCRLNRVRPLHCILNEKSVQARFLPSLFSEILIPPSSDGIGKHSLCFHNLHVFIENFCLSPKTAGESLEFGPHPSSCYSSSSSPSSSPGSEVSVSFKETRINNYFQSTYLVLVPSYIIDEDYDALMMVGGFLDFLQREIDQHSKIPLHYHPTELSSNKKKKQHRSITMKIEPYSLLPPSYTLIKKTLEEKVNNMCTSVSGISSILPKLLLHPDRAPLIFYLKKVVTDGRTLADLFTVAKDPILRELILELGRTMIIEIFGNEEAANKNSDTSKYSKDEVLVALKKGALNWIKQEPQQKTNTVSTSFSMERQNSIDGVDAVDIDARKMVGDQAVEKWVGSRFMYLLVNIVTTNFQNCSDKVKIHKLACLYSMLDFIVASEGIHYLPQMMNLIDTAFCVSCKPSTEFVKPGEHRVKEDTELSHSKICLLTVKILSRFVLGISKSNNNVKSIGENITRIVVSLFPVLNEAKPNVPQDPAKKSSIYREKSINEAVGILEFLVSEERGEEFSKYFHHVPFLPLSPKLQPVRDTLRKYGVNLDPNLLRLTQWKSSGITSREVSNNSNLSGNNIDNSEDVQRREALQKRIITLCSLMPHENVGVRKVVLEHLKDLLRANRSNFRKLAQTEEIEAMRYLTVVDRNALIGIGSVTILMKTLRSRCIDETDQSVKLAIATVLGEIGAIDPNRVTGNLSTSNETRTETVMQKISGIQSTGNDERVISWRIVQPPWKSLMVDYKLHLVKVLVRALKAAADAMNQHKIAFAIQELLKQLNDYAEKEHPDNDLVPTSKNTAEKKNHMNKWLVSYLSDEKVNVYNIVEPFWSTSYAQRESQISFRSPPFFSKARSYFGWFSHWCRYMINKSRTNDRSRWKNLFHACRSAIRSPAGLTLAEFLLPLLILDMLCFGSTTDADLTIKELKGILSQRSDSKKSPFNMESNDLQRAFNTVFMALDTLQVWADRETEEKYERNSKRNFLNRSTSESNEVDDDPFSWPPDDSIERINDLLNELPYSLCSEAAASVGMDARAIRYMELEARSKIAKSIYDEGTDEDYRIMGPGKALAPINCVDLALFQRLLGKLHDFDTMKIISRERELTTPNYFNTTDSAREREVYRDWMGALQGYERALQLTRYSPVDSETHLELKKGMMRCLLELGQFESILNQVGEIPQLLPSGCEAAWRLGKWDVLDKLVHTCDLSNQEYEESQYHIYLGEALLGLQRNDANQTLHGIENARFAVMSSLSNVARESYTSFYPYLIHLHCLREIENTAEFLNHKETSKSSDSYSMSFSELANSSDSPLGWDWTGRLQMSAPELAGSNMIVNIRLALAKLSNNSPSPSAFEGKLWLENGKLARKAGLYNIANTAFAHADFIFSNLNNDDTTQDDIQLAVAKVKYLVGESKTALRMIQIDDNINIQELLLMDKSSLRSEVVSLSTRQVVYITQNDVREINHVELMRRFGRRLLEATQWSEGGLKTVAEVLDQYKLILEVCPGWERAHFKYAKYLDSLFKARIIALASQYGILDSDKARMEILQKDSTSKSFVIEAIKQYGKALEKGEKHSNQAMPRLLTLWFDITSSLTSEDGNLNEALREMNTLHKKVGVHLFYLVLPQLVSRVSHKNPYVAQTVKKILKKVLIKFPYQAMWPLACLRNSVDKTRSQIGEDIFYTAGKELKKRGRNGHNVLAASKVLFKYFIDLARYMPKNRSKREMSIMFPDLEDVALRDFIPPIQAALSLNRTFCSKAENRFFPASIPRMRSFAEKIQIMTSKAKPKKVTAFAIPASLKDADPVRKPMNEDIGELHFLVKQEAKGDLRKDARVQDLNNVINSLLLGSGNGQQRRKLHLRTFSVVCLTEECGLLEWVPNTNCLRNLVTESYNPQAATHSDRRRGRRITNWTDPCLTRNFKACQETYTKEGMLTKAAMRFNKLCVEPYPPVFYWWFIQKFSDPNEWFEARTRFALSAAAWSAVGFVIGLGDRHSENILVDTSNGQCVHVDFDCIFDKGLSLPLPEIVPFRLTQNMVDAFGPCGYEGTYRGGLTSAMRTLRENKDTLLSVLEPFVNDPIIDWRKLRAQQRMKNSGRKVEENKDTGEGKHFIEVIDSRLRGCYNLGNPNLKRFPRKDAVTRYKDESSDILPLSIEGQVDRMIKEATSQENLVQLYVGWMPWI